MLVFILLISLGVLAMVPGCPCTKRTIKMLNCFAKSACGLALLLASAHASAAEPPLLRDRTEAERPTLLLIGSPHFANHFRDVSNTKVPEVLSPQRQAEIARVAAALLAFHPTKVAVEVSRDKQEQLSSNYRAYLAGTYTLTSEEADQIGMRVAAAAKLPDIYAIDWNKMPPGRVEDFDFETWANQNGRAPLLERLRDSGRSLADGKRLLQTSVADWLTEYNSPEALAASHRRYFDFAMLNEGDNFPGANWVANWYGRNLKIFSKLVTLADKPGDRVLVIYGAGHIPTLREFAQQSGAFKVADPIPLLEQARKVAQ